MSGSTRATIHVLDHRIASNDDSFPILLDTFIFMQFLSLRIYSLVSILILVGSRSIL